MSDLSVQLGELLANKPDYLLMIASLVLGFVAFVVTTVAGLGKRGGGESDATVAAVLANPAIQERIRSNTIDVKELVEQLSKVDGQNQRTSISQIVHKVNDDIKWDVAGVIGILVTIILLFAVVSRTFDTVPKELTAGWTMILGFYFGKAVK